MFEKIAMLAVLVASAAPAATPKQISSTRFEKGDLMVTNARGNLLYTRQYPTMTACMRAKATIEAQNPAPKPDPRALVSTDAPPILATCIPR